MPRPFRLPALALVAVVSMTAATLSTVATAAAAAPTRTCPAPALATVPCVIAVQNNSTSPTLTPTPARLVATTVARGKYAIVASTVVSNSSGTGEPLPFASCTLKAGATVLDEQVVYTINEATTVTLLGAANLTAPTRLAVSCADPTGFASLTADYTRLQATRLGTLRRPAEGTSKAMECPAPSTASIPCGIEVQTSSSTAIGASDTAVAGVNLGPGLYTMFGRVAFGATGSGSASVECRSDNAVIGLSDGTQFILQGKTAALTLGGSFSLGGVQTVEVTCALRSGSQATVTGVRLTIVRVATLVPASTDPAKCPVKRSTVPCAITAQGNGALTSTHSNYAEAHVGAGNYIVSAAVSITSADPQGGFHLVDCALVSGAGEFGAAFDVLGGQGDTLFMIDAHRTTAADLTLSCADDSGSGQLAVSTEITATRVGTLFFLGH